MYIKNFIHLQFEQMHMSLPSGVERSVVVTGAQSVVNRDIAAYKKAFGLFNFTLSHDQSNFGGVYSL